MELTELPTGETVRIPPGEPVDLTSHRHLLLMRERLVAEIKVMEERLEVTEAQVKQALGTSAVGLVDGTEVIVFTEVTTSKFNVKDFKAERADLYDAYVKPSTYRRSKWRTVPRGDTTPTAAEGNW